MDVFTIRDEIGTVNHLTITMVGDLKHGRTVHSLARILTLYDGIKFRFVSPPSLKMPQEVKKEIEIKGLTWQEFDCVDSAIPDTDVLYVTRYDIYIFVYDFYWSNFFSSLGLRFDLKCTYTTLL